ncbi:hypothetical protein [Croceivirga thetidis]|uniref:Uncharacterized protein n=1 Tax=Croceivirga thetidis TaxID=2721623 RepID=A0ABX1GM74_9FLAO|nr:hypothetical protein [Croceivirga thetidis]NKI30969.1 hypothetical protein [Croceivirga thetidis]
MKRLSLLSILFMVLACSSDSDGINLPNEAIVNYEFSDGFETSSEEFDLLFPSDNSRWSNIQIVNPKSGFNRLTLSKTAFSEGNQSLLIDSKKSDEILSKVDIVKSGFSAPEEGKITIVADFYIDSEESISNLLLIDLECCSCWDSSVSENQCPGVRLMVTENDHLVIERGKIAGSTLSQNTTQIPRKEWFTITWEMQLSQSENGFNKLSIDGNEILSQNGMNMPNAEIFRTLFAEEGIEFELQEPLFYERLQIGATANPDGEDVLIYIDNFKLTITNT